MCILIVLRNRVQGRPLVVGANRDEFRDRPWRPPLRTGPVLAPRDLRAGGTWIALHDAGLTVAVTNRPEPDPDPERPSRGILALDLAGTGDAGRAVELLEAELRRARRNAFRVLVATAAEAYVGVHPGPDGSWGEILEVDDGLHTLTNLRGLDELDHRGALDAADLREGTPLEAALPRMKEALAVHEDRGPGGADAICKHGEDRGTLSSSILALPAPGSGEAPLFLFAPGPPCETAWEEIPTRPAP
jgi:hypothetical protein